MFIFRTIFQPWALSSYIPAAERGLFTHYARSSRLFHLLNLALENMDECFWSINRDRKLCLCRSHCHQNVVLQTTAKKLKFKLIIPELVVLILQAKPLEKKKKSETSSHIFRFCPLQGSQCCCLSSLTVAVVPSWR